MLYTQGAGFTAFYTNDGVPKTDPGITITPALNSYPAYAEVMAGALVLEDCYAIEINFNSNAFNAELRDTLVNIGVDPSGGTNYTTLIPNLLASDAGGWALSGAGGGGHWYYFPIFIKAGSSIAAQASVNQANLRTMKVLIKLYAKPSRPELVRVGSYAESIGVVLASSKGTNVVGGVNGADGSWTAIGTTVKNLWWWEMSMGAGDAGLANAWFCADLATGDVVNNNIIIARQRIITSSAEAINKLPAPQNTYREVPAGTGIVARLANSAATNENLVSICAYGVGG